jgi:septal ring factor EnvC (AmiA/AmiB activator)
MLECQANHSNGFVKFKTKMQSEPTSGTNESRQQGVIIPEHLRSNLPDPLEHLNKKDGGEEAKIRSSSELSAKADRLKAELAQLNEERAARLEAFKSKQKGLAPSSLKPPPPLSFSSKKGK